MDKAWKEKMLTEKYITFQELARLWGISKQAVRTKMIRWGLYEKHYLLGCVVDRQKLREYIINKEKEND